MAHAKYIDLIAKYLSGNIDTPERTALLQWAESDPENQQFFDEMAQLWSLADQYEEDVFEADFPAAWDQLDRRLGDSGAPAASGGSAKVIPLSIRSVLLRAAAATILLVAASYGIYSVWTGAGEPEPQYAMISTQANERRDVTLPDGSQVWLNENTRLSYEEGFTERTVELRGEAFFDVAHRDDSPFVIVSGEAQTTVLGTAFNVRAYPGEEQIEVTVQRGKVALGKKATAAGRPAEPVTLEAGMTGVFKRTEAKATLVEAQLINADAWKTGVLNLDGLKVEQAITALERYYDVTFNVENKDLLNCSVTGLVFDHEPLDTVLKGLSFMMSLNIERSSDTTVVVSGKQGCPE